MERKITHYVVKPEHIDHYYRLTGMDEARDFKQDSPVYKTLTEAKVLELWCDAVFEKPRIKGWFVLDQRVPGRTFFTMTGPHEVKQVGGYEQIFIDQEIE